MNITDLDRNLINRPHAELGRQAGLAGRDGPCMHLLVQARKEDGS